MHVFLLCKYARVDPFMLYTWEDLFFYEKIYGMADFCIDGSIDDSLFKCTEKRYKRSGTDNNGSKRECNADRSSKDNK